MGTFSRQKIRKKNVVMIIERDKYLNKWVVWQVIGNSWFEVFCSKYKKDCQNFASKITKKGKI